MATPIVLPELGVKDEPIRISCWLVDVGDSIEVNDRVVEVLIQGITFDVSSTEAGRLTRIEKTFDMAINSGDILGWIEPVEDKDDEE